MAWLAGPSGPLGRDARTLMPLVAAAQMSAASTMAAAPAPTGAAGAVAGVHAGPTLRGAHQAAGEQAVAASPTTAADHLPPLPLLRSSPDDAPHSPVPPDLFEREECLTPAAPQAPLLPQAGPCVPGSSADACGCAAPPPIDPASVRPELVLPDNSLHVLEQLLGGLEDPPMHMLVDLLA
jgi:hypothetical protein